MSYKVSNLFASRVFAEHPLALWPLDDPVYFISSINQEDKDILNWELINAEEQVDPKFANVIPMPDEIFNVITPISGSTGYMEAIGPEINIAEKIDITKTTISISLNVFAYDSVTQSYEIGFRYFDEDISDYIYDTELFTTIGDKVWQQIYYTSKIEDIDGFENFEPYIKINHQPGLLPDFYNLYDVGINGLSVGQWSEMYNSFDTGFTPQELQDKTLKSILPQANIKVAGADAYGLSTEKDGYYVIENNKLLALNSGMPMVFGSSNITEVYPPITPKVPSIILPGQGFLNKQGQFSEVTAEFWLRIYTRSSDPIRIFGPISSKDGLYVEEEFLTLRIGKYSKSYFVGKWYRPMLIDIRYSPTIASLMINGDVVLTMDLDEDQISFPIGLYDWLGFFAHEDAQPFEIDSVAIYPYIVPDQIAKKRYVFGQGVTTVENVINNFDGEPVYIDFPFAKYTSTLNYPDMTGWNAGFFNNLDANNDYLTFPRYSLPEINYVGEDLSIFTVEFNPRTWEETKSKIWLDWTALNWSELRKETSADVLDDNFSIQEGEYPFISLRPNESYNDVFGSIYFKSANPTLNAVRSIFGVFKSPQELTSEEVVMQFINNFNGNLFKITIGSEGLKYVYNNTILKTKSVSPNSDFIAGIDIQEISKNYAAVLGNFFANPANLSLSVAGYENNTFNGRIYSVTFNDSLFTVKDLLPHIDSDGFFVNDNSAERGSDTFLIEYIGSYTYHPILTDTSIFVDIGCYGYWEDSLPLSYFGKFVNDRKRNSYYDLDLIQFNIDNPSPIVIDGHETQTEGQDLRINTYITIQDFKNVGKIPYTIYDETEVIGSNRVLDIDKYTYNDILTTKFEVVDGTIIFPPKDLVNFEEFYITTHIEMKTTGIFSRIVQLKRMSYSSLAYDESNFYSIGTRTGSQIFPFTRYSNAYAYKDKNPFTIYKDSTKYMYLTADSGISVLPYETEATRGLSIPVNQQKNEEYLLGGMQLWMFYNKSNIIEETIKVARLKTNNQLIDVYLVPESGGERGSLKFFDALLGIEEIGIVIYQNGGKVKNPVIKPNSWTSLVISFGESLILNNQIGQLELYEGFLFNNIAFFQKSTEILGTVQITRNWSEVKTSIIDVPGPLDIFVNNPWSLWLDLNWSEVEQTEEVKTFTINGSELFQTYFGLPKAVSSDDSKLLINSDSFRIVQGTIWTEFVGKPV